METLEQQRNRFITIFEKYKDKINFDFKGHIYFDCNLGGAPLAKYVEAAGAKQLIVYELGFMQYMFSGKNVIKNNAFLSMKPGEEMVQMDRGGQGLRKNFKDEVEKYKPTFIRYNITEENIRNEGMLLEFCGMPKSVQYVFIFIQPTVQVPQDYLDRMEKEFTIVNTIEVDEPGFKTKTLLYKRNKVT